MPDPPDIKRAVAFFDGQNLFHHAKTAFGHTHPNYDPVNLTAAIAYSRGWTTSQVRFYTGVPDRAKDPRWHAYWSLRLAALRRRGVHVTSRRLHYHPETIVLNDGSTTTIDVPREKGIDLRLGLDVVRMARTDELDVALIFSQDQDLAEVAAEIRAISQATGRWIKVACAFPDSPTASSARGINDTDWIRIRRADYDACLDPRDYRPKNWTSLS